jgi:hypothetical protein
MKIRTILTLLVILTSSVFRSVALPIIANEPTVQTFSFSASPGDCSEIDLDFVPGDGSRRIVIAHEGSPVTQFPQDGFGYSAGSIFGTGANLGNDNFVVYNAGGTSTTVTGLNGGAEYFFAIFELNGSGSNANYMIIGYLEANAIAPGLSISVSSSVGDICRGDSVRLEVHGAEGYFWTPSTSLSSPTDSVVWAKPNSTQQYTVQGSSSSGCTDSKSITITVYALPNVSLGSFQDKCLNGADVTLASGSPSGGVYSGPGVSANKFHPSVAGVGTHNITYTYSDIHGCVSSDASTITVISPPSVSFSTLEDVCENAPVFALTGGSPAGGVYSGTGVSSGLFDASDAGVGVHSIRYIYTAPSGCADTSYEDQRVRDLPNVHFSSLQPTCLNVPTFTLTGGSPAGGNYTGTGVNNSQFSPLVSGAGTFTITYTFTDSHGCSDEDTSNLTVNTLPSVSFSPLTAVCQNTGPVNLTGGSPAGGTYSGTGVGGGKFYSGIAGPGQHQVTYTYMNSLGCSNSATQTMTVNASPHPDLGPDLMVCSNEFAHLTPGAFSGYTWSTGAHTSYLNVDTSGHGLGTFVYWVNVANNFGCTNKDTILITFDPCTGINTISSKPGTISVFPNPFSSECTLVSEEGSDVFIYDLKGTLVLEKFDINSVMTFGNNLAAGAYVLKVKKGNSFLHQLIIKN